MNNAEKQKAYRNRLRIKLLKETIVQITDTISLQHKQQDELIRLLKLLKKEIGE